MKEQKVELRSLACSILGVKGLTEVPRWEYEEWQATIQSHGTTQTNKLIGA
jgi:hypothetical protein